MLLAGVFFVQPMILPDNPYELQGQPGRRTVVDILLYQGDQPRFEVLSGEAAKGAPLQTPVRLQRPGPSVATSMPRVSLSSSTQCKPC